MSGCGFGDALDVNEQLADYEAWLHHRVNSMLSPNLTPSGDDRSDLAQVGMVAMWKALQTYDEDKGSLPAWLTMKASGAMKDHLRPAPTKRGAENSLDALLETLAPDYTPDELLEHPDMLERLVRAYHRGEIAKAFNTLTPRQQEYVHLRFWKGLGTKALTEHFGYDATGLWSSSKNGAKKKLREALAHLV